jgi:hypothetical protein
MEKGKRTGNRRDTGRQRSKPEEGNTPDSQRGRRENEEGRLLRMVWGGGNDQDWGRTGIGGV